MATNITAGNATNGAAISSDNTGTLDIKTGTGAGTTAISINASQQVTLPGNLVVTGTATVNGVPVGGNYILTSYVSPGSWDVNAKKAAGLKAVKVTVVGAGGSGGAGNIAPVGAGGGGGGGGAAIYYAPASTLTPSPTGIAITAGPGTNSFGPLASATAGGNGGATNGVGATGGSGTGGTVNFVGGAGTNNTASNVAGNGGVSIVGGAGKGATTSIASTAGTNYGGGGGGGIPSPSAAGAGAPGIVIVEEFY